MHRLLSRLSAALRHSRFRRLRDENGSVLFVSAAAMLVLCGVTGLGVDVGMWYRTKRAMQNAADSAAMAAALDNSAATYQAAGKAVAAQYGFVDGSGGVNVAVANAQSCPGGGTSNCYTATVSQQAPQYFSQVLGIAAPTLSASATASPATTGANDCVLALNPTASSAVLLNGTVSINLSCGLAVNSSSSQALLMNGTNSITATSVDVVGNVLRNPSAGNPITPRRDHRGRQHPGSLRRPRGALASRRRLRQPDKLQRRQPDLEPFCRCKVLQQPDVQRRQRHCEFRARHLLL